MPGHTFKFYNYPLLNENASVLFRHHFLPSNAFRHVGDMGDFA